MTDVVDAAYRTEWPTSLFATRAREALADARAERRSGSATSSSRSTTRTAPSSTRGGPGPTPGAEGRPNARVGAAEVPETGSALGRV